MTSRRRSTVHDLAALRLHPDGTRVQNSESNLRLRRAKYTARDGRGNWFARDAGGVGTVKTRRNPVRMSEGVQEAEVFDLTGADRGEGPSTPQGTRERADEEQEKEFKDGRAKKRRRFAEDLSFLESSPVPSTSAIPTATVENFLNDTPASNDTTATNLRNPSSVGHDTLAQTGFLILSLHRTYLNVCTILRALTTRQWGNCMMHQGKYVEPRNSNV